MKRITATIKTGNFSLKQLNKIYLSLLLKSLFSFPWRVSWLVLLSRRIKVSFFANLSGISYYIKYSRFYFNDAGCFNDNFRKLNL